MKLKWVVFKNHIKRALGTKSTSKERQHLLNASLSRPRTNSVCLNAAFIFVYYLKFPCSP